jgi:hypothetical protein
MMQSKTLLGRDHTLQEHDVAWIPAPKDMGIQFGSKNKAPAATRVHVKQQVLESHTPKVNLDLRCE